MSLDIGAAFREGISRTFAKNGLLLVGVFIAIGLAFLFLTQTLIVATAEAMLEFVQGLGPEELDGISEAEYEEMVAELETAVAEAREFAPLALGLPAWVAAGGLLLFALLSEAASIVAVRVFASDETDAIPSELLTDNILLATLNGFIGALVVWGLILLGLVFFILPGIALAVLFFFLRQEIALKDKNFVQAMADSWRKTKGYRIEVFLLGFLVVLVSQADALFGFVGELASPIVGAVISTAVGALLAVFGAAVVTRGYVQIDGQPDEVTPEDDESEDDPYSKALGPDDIPE